MKINRHFKNPVLLWETKSFTRIPAKLDFGSRHCTVKKYLHIHICETYCRSFYINLYLTLSSSLSISINIYIYLYQHIYPSLQTYLSISINISIYLYQNYVSMCLSMIYLCKYLCISFFISNLYICTYVYIPQNLL